ncbi:hypothetical protein GIB67_027203 [Kingdonia uniflora]|uniref:SWIM-type domain-containing protein n=1 Tax=Kingdonia uniflora TaxID=39325 RepID=A0A7J7KY99_9MAGN|nr:hypothetical protein GIB67_027203 [Kingdonia uniflora]
MVLHWGGRWEDPRRDIGYTDDLYVDGHKHNISNVNGDQFYFHGLLDFAFSTMSEMNVAFQPGTVLDVMTLYLGNKFLVRNNTDLLKMWKMSDVESLWDAHFYIEQRDEVPLGIVDPIDLDAIPEVLLIDSDDNIPIEEIATQVEPIVEPIVSNIQAQRLKELITKSRTKASPSSRTSPRSRTSLKRKRKKESTTRSEPKTKKTRPSELLEEALDELPPLYLSDDEVVAENTNVGGNTVDEGVEDMGGNTADGEHRGGVGDMGINTDNWAELDPDNLNAKEGYYSTHTSQDGDDGPTQESIDKCDLEFRDLAKEYDNIFAEEEDAVHSVPPQPTYGKLRVRMEWATVVRLLCIDENCEWMLYARRTTDCYTFTLRKNSNLKHTCSSGAKNRLANATWVAKQVESVMRFVRTTKPVGIDGFLNGYRPVVSLDRCFLKGKYGGVCLSAIGLDGNNGLLPLGVYFYRQKRLTDAVANIFPFANHRHMYKNMKKVHRDTHLESLVWKAARTYKQVEKKNLLDKLKLENPSAHDWLMNELFEHWARSHFDFTAKCEHIKNNFSDSFNNWILMIRDKPLHKALEKMNLMLMKLIFDRRKKAKDWEEKGCYGDGIKENILSWEVLPCTQCNPTIANSASGMAVNDKCKLKFLKLKAKRNYRIIVFRKRRTKGKVCGLVLVPRVQTHIDKLKRQYGQYRIEGTKKGDGNTGQGITGQYVAIAVTGQRWRVNLGTHECDCHEWQVTGLPCVHVVSIIVPYRYSWANFVSEYHKVFSYVKTYKDAIYPVVNPSEWGHPQPPYFLPPPLVRGPGRPRKEMIYDPDEKRPYKRCGT